MTQPPSWIGHTLGGRYQIEAELGYGGMATVYKATDPNLRRVVAIKLIHPHISSNPDFIRRFEAEATVVAQLRHANIIQVFDFNHDGDIYYIVFEFVPGETLQAQLQRLNQAGRQMEMGQLLKTATAIADALGYAHSRDIIHRDIKPANVMLNVQGEAILTDFGIVKILGGTQHTATGAVLGTARYMSPEQIRGQRVDLRSDIYSYGNMLYEMVGGRPPFNADSAMTLMMMHINDPVPDVRQIRSSVSPQLVAVINKAMAKDPNQRYQTMAELLRDLRGIQAGSSTGTVMAAGKTMLDADLTDLLEPESAVNDPGTYLPPTEYPVGANQLPAATAVAPRQNRTMFWGIGVLVLAAIIVVGFFVFRPSRIADNGLSTATAESISVSEGLPSVEATAVSEIIPPENTATATDAPPTATLAATATNPPPATATMPPPATATMPLPTTTSPPPTATNPPPTQVTQLSAQITGISLEGDRYVVNYTTVGYTEGLPGQHVHFFFNTVPQDQAGLPGSGPWQVYGGPRPFTGYGPADRPGNASQLCVLVANPDHSIIVNSGNCVNLP
jgi:serine/threonine protein kinase